MVYWLLMTPSVGSTQRRKLCVWQCVQQCRKSLTVQQFTLSDWSIQDANFHYLLQIGSWSGKKRSVHKLVVAYILSLAKPHSQEPHSQALLPKTRLASSLLLASYPGRLEEEKHFSPPTRPGYKGTLVPPFIACSSNKKAPTYEQARSYGGGEGWLYCLLTLVCSWGCWPLHSGRARPVGRETHLAR